MIKVGVVGHIGAQLGLQNFIGIVDRGFLTQVPRIHGQSERMAKLDDYVNGLEVEIKKIKVFTLELPLCLRIVNQAMVIMKEELAQCKKSKGVPVLKEFIPLKRTNDEKDEKNEIENDINSRDKMNWLSSVQLCNSRDQNHHPISGSGNNNQTSKLDKIKGVEEEMSPPMTNGILRSGINMAIGTAFVSFKGRNNFPLMMMGKEDGDEFNVPHGLTPRDLGIKNPGDEIDSGGFSSKSSCSRSGSFTPVTFPLENMFLSSVFMKVRSLVKFSAHRSINFFSEPENAVAKMLTRKRAANLTP